jgi:hypothetical protein
MQISVKIIPQCNQNKIVGFYGALLKIQMQGVPEKGKLNEALIGFLAEQFNIPKSALQLKQGFTNPVKRIKIGDQYSLKVDLFLMKFKIDPSDELID